MARPFFSLAGVMQRPVFRMPIKSPTLATALGRSVRLNPGMSETISDHGLDTKDLLMTHGVQPVLGWPAARRKSILLRHPRDGQGVWIGADPSVTMSNGYFIAPGVSIELENYNGPIWAASERGVQWLFASVT
jgi:hypothetical protein